MDEPASALDPISTLAIEDLIGELKKDYTIVIVTHNMQQATRASDYTAFFNIEGTGQPGYLVEMDTTEKIFGAPSNKATEGHARRALRLELPAPGPATGRPGDFRVSGKGGIIVARRPHGRRSSRRARTMPVGTTNVNDSSAAPDGSAAPTTEAAALPAAVFRVTDLNVFYGDARALRDVTIDIRPNEITALIGPSGCGKSSFLRCLNRMNDHPAGACVEGEVLFRGQDLYAPNVDPVDVRRRVGMVFQTPNPFPKSIRENLLFGMEDQRAAGRRRRASRPPCARPRCGMRSRTSSTRTPSRCRVASNSVSASPGRSRSSPR